MRLALVPTAALMLLATPAAWAGESPTGPTDRPEIGVDLFRSRGPSAEPVHIRSPRDAAPRSLRFLYRHRIFLLSQLAASRGPGAPDEELLAMLSERLLSATRGLGDARMSVPTGTLLGAAGPRTLDELSAALDSLHTRIAAIETRLAGIRHDFSANQETELLVALSAPGAAAARIDSLSLYWNGYRVAGARLAASDREALAAAAYRPLHRGAARPLPQTLELEVVTTDGHTVRGQAEIAPAENRLTVVVLELNDAADPDDAAELDDAAMSSRVWTL